MNRYLVFAAMALAGSQAQAHHSFAMFDRKSTVVVDGTLQKVELISPHSWYTIMVPDAQGAPVIWRAEGGGPQDGNSPTAGYFVPGVKVKLTVHPFRDGRPGGEFLKLTSEDGTKQMGGMGFGPGGPPPK